MVSYLRRILVVYKSCGRHGEPRKGERTTHLVVNAFLQGFRAVDTGDSISGMMICFGGLTHPQLVNPSTTGTFSIYLWEE